jgi:glycosyltransferase involved in cell wall biosynthesis
MNILIAIPAFNCSNQLVRVIEQCAENEAQFYNELLIIDNQSSDDTLKTALVGASKNKIKTTVIQNLLNYGLGGSHKIAFDYCLKNKFDGVIIFHGDDQGKILDISKYLKQLYLENYDCLLGARFMRESRLIGYSKFRIFGNYIFNLLHSIVLGKRIYDMGSGLNYFSSQIIKSLPIYDMPDDLTFNNVLLINLISFNKKILFFPISWREDDQVSNVKFFRQVIKILKYLALYLVKGKRITKMNFSNPHFNSYDYLIVNEER